MNIQTQKGYHDGSCRAAQFRLIKERYKANPEDAYITLKARGTFDDQNIACKVETGRLLRSPGSTQRPAEPPRTVLR